MALDGCLIASAAGAHASPLVVFYGLRLCGATREYGIVSPRDGAEHDEPEEGDEGDEGDAPLRRHDPERQALHRRPARPVLDEKVALRVGNVAPAASSWRLSDRSGLGWRQTKTGGPSHALPHNAPLSDRSGPGRRQTKTGGPSRATERPLFMTVRMLPEEPSVRPALLSGWGGHVSEADCAPKPFRHRVRVRFRVRVGGGLRTEALQTSGRRTRGLSAGTPPANRATA